MKSDMKYKKTITNKLTVKGVITDDGKIYYCDENGTEIEMPIINLFSDFIDDEVTVSITDNFEEDLSQEFITSIDEE